MSANMEDPGTPPTKPPPPQRSLGSHAARGAAVTMGGQAAKIGIQFGGIILLARLLTPYDYGLLAMVVSLVGIGEILRDFGLSSAAIQAKSVSHEQRSNLFWINSGIGLVLGLVIYFSAGGIAAFYREPALVPIAQVLSFTFLVNGMTTQYRAQLVRDLKFGKIATADVTAQAFGLGVGVACALLWKNYWALVVQQLVQALTGLLVMMIATRWLPGRPRRHVEMRGFLSFGWTLMATQMLAYASQNLGQVIIGNRIGAQALGLYNRAFQLLMMPLYQINAPATTVALPVLSRLQDEPARFDAFLLRGQTVLLHVIISIFVFGCAQARPMIELVLGAHWVSAVEIFQVLTIGGLFQAAGYAAYWVFLSKGLGKVQLMNSVVGRIVMILLIFAGSHWGAIGVAAGYSLGLALIWPMSLVWISRTTQAPAREMFHNGLRAILGYGVGGVASWYVVQHAMRGQELILQLLAGGGVMLLAFAVVCLLWPAFRRDVVSILNSRSLLASARAQKGVA